MIEGLLDQVRVTWNLMTDPRVPLTTKVIPILAIAYVLSPFDFLPDFFPGLGQLDDIGIVLAGMKLFESVAPNQIVKEYRKH